jgi:hypothetical protein
MAPQIQEGHKRYVSLRLNDDSRLWTTAPYDEVTALGYDRSNHPPCPATDDFL